MGQGKGRVLRSRGDRDFPRYRFPRYPALWRPIDVVHARQEMLNIIRHTRHGRELASPERLAAPQRWTDPKTGLLNHIEGLDEDSIGRWLEYADLYLVSEPMTDLARQAGARMPEVGIYAEDVPSPRGLIVWAGAVPAQMDFASVVRRMGRPRGERDPLDVYARLVPMRGLLWSTVSTKLGPGLAVIGLGEMWAMLAAMQSVEPGLDIVPTPIQGWPLSLGDTTGMTFGESGVWPGSPISPTLVASWFLMNQHVSVTTSERVTLPPRQPGEPRRAPQEVRTVTLRRAKRVTEHGREPANPGRGYSVQFPVEGHWHTYWTGQGRAVKKIRWVDEYWKGDPDAPVVGGERVNVWRR